MDMDMDQDDYGCLYLPPGFRFHPMDEEIITCYLWEKVMDGSFCARAITEIDLNKNEPWDLPSKAKMGEKEWYFFCKRDRKYPTGMRTNRATEAGYWKATGKDKEIYKGDDGNLVGMKKTLVFYLGRAPKGKKTNWVMHEYRLDGVCSYQSFNTTPSQEEWVVCRVFHKKVEAKGNSDEASGRATSFSDNAFLVDELLDYCSPGLPRLVDAPSSVISTAGHDLAAVGFNFDHANSPFAAAAAATMSHCAPNTSFPRPNHMATGRRNVYHNTLHQGGASFGPSHSQLGTGCGTVDDKKAAEICSTGEEVNGNQYYNDLEVLWKC